MSAERVDQPRWRRRRADTPVAPDLVAVADPVPTARPPLTSRTPTTGGSWAGRASDHRRAQVRSRGPESEPLGPTGPVESTGRGVSGGAARAEEQRHTLDPELWNPVVEVLRRYVGSLSAVLLCTADGDAIAVHGVPDSDVALAARLNSVIFTAGGDLMANPVDTVQLTSGATLTVITTVRAAASDDHVLSVSATDVSPGVLLMRTRQAADDLSALLVAGA